MRYFGRVFRPPSEAYSLIVQVTYGCSHNTCAFCDMYKEKRFKLRPMDEILEDFRLARQTYRHVERVFLADGDALVRKASELYTILDTIRELFPECQRVTTYGSPSSIRLRTEEETPLYDWVHAGTFQLLTQAQVLEETRLLVENLDSPGSVFRMNHASNYLLLKGTLNQDKDAMLAEIQRAKQDMSKLRPEAWRGV